MILCICGNLDPNCVSQSGQKNDWESSRFCNTDAKAGKVARAWAAVARSTPGWKICSYSIRTLWLFHIYWAKVQQEPAAVNFHFRIGREVPSEDRAYPLAEFFLMHHFDSDKVFFYCFGVFFPSFFWLELQTVILASAEFEGNEKVNDWMTEI